MRSPVIRLSGLSKRYGSLAAVDDVTLQVFPGEVYALLGLNGAGKTTLIRVLLGMVRASAGHVEVAGCRVPEAGCHGGIAADRA
jgi:ABC-2 type transport system ATP-binding protein